jgi:urease accessory protein
MDGDGQLVQLAAGPGTRALVTGQSATRIHPGLRGFSTQQWVVRVAAGAVLAVLPGPAIPFAGSRYYQRVTIDLEPGAGLVWGDLWLAGRYARGDASEQFQFATLVQDLAVRRGSGLVFRDRFCWQGPWDRDAAAWHFGGAPACGSLFVTGAGPQDWRAAAESEGAAVFATAFGDTCLRWTGASEAVTLRLVGCALRVAAMLSGGPGDRPWFQAHELAPNHWFAQRT